MGWKSRKDPANKCLFPSAFHLHISRIPRTITTEINFNLKFIKNQMKCYHLFIFLPVKSLPSEKYVIIYCNDIALLVLIVMLHYVPMFYVKYVYCTTM